MSEIYHEDTPFLSLLILTVSASVITSNLPLLAGAEVQLPDGWQSVAPREEIRPTFSFEPQGGPNHAGSMVITHDRARRLDGWFQKSFPVSGGECYRFQAVRNTRNVRRAAPQRAGTRALAG